MPPCYLPNINNERSIFRTTYNSKAENTAAADIPVMPVDHAKAKAFAPDYLILTNFGDNAVSVEVKFFDEG